jgi:purine-binding chemotaxis protein CheW
MRSGATTGRPEDATATRESLVAELRTLEDRLQRAQARLLELGGESVPGLYLAVEVAGRRGLLPTARVAEIVQLVATTPLAGAPPHVLGSFVYRGGPVVAVDLGALLRGDRREPGLDAQIVILAGAPPVGLVVDHVERLVDAPRRFSGDTADAPEAWRGSAFVTGYCVEDGEVLPLLDPTPALAGIPGVAP